MTAWWSLTKKELRVGLPAFLFPIIAFALLISVAAYFGNRAGFAWEAVTGVAVTATGVQVLYLVYYLLLSLSVEKKKMHLWLHTPMPAYSLLLAKLVAAIVSMAITFFITGTTLVIGLNLSESIPIELIPMTDLIGLGFAGGIHIFLIAISFAAWFLFFWMIFLLFTRSLGSFLSLLSTFFLFIIINVVFYGWFTSTAIHDALTGWGAINLSNVLTSLSISANPETGAEIATDTMPMTIYLGNYLFETLLVLLLFYAACWMLDRKVEV